MIAAVYCPGPSLCSGFPSPDNYDATWAVNTALKLVKTDWLAAGDIPIFRGILGENRPKIGVLTMGGTAEILQKDPVWASFPLVPWADVPLIDEHEKRGRPLSWSVQTALCHASHLGATQVDLYGCDVFRSDFDPWQTTDATGYEGEDRNRTRWDREREDLRLTFALLFEHGTTVLRIDL